MSNGKSDKRGGYYWKGEKPYISVTKVLEIIDKPALRYWVGKEVYYAMVNNPSLTEQEALAAPYKTSDSAKSRGSTIHSIVEAYKHTQEYLDGIPAEFAGYATAFYNWVKDNDIEILEHEKTIFSEEHGYAGTCDLIVKNRQSGKTFLVDVKTGKDIYPEAFLQLSAYKQALEEEGIKIDHIAVCLLQEDKSYKFGEGEPRLDVFLNAMQLWRWKNEDIVKKVGKQLPLKQNGGEE